MGNRVFLRKKKKENADVAHTDLAKWPERLDKRLNMREILEKKKESSKTLEKKIKPSKRGATFRPSFSSKVIILLPFRKNTLAHRVF